VAGVGLHLARLLGRDGYASLVGAYGYAGLVSAGPWVLSIAALLAIGAVAHGRAPELLVVITWSTAASLIVTGPLQLVFGRFVADCVYEREPERIAPNLIGALELVTVASGALATVVAFTAFDVSLGCRLLLIATFVASCDTWLLLVLLSGVRAHHAVIAVFVAAQLASVGCAFALRGAGLEGLLLGFVTGQAGALFGMLALVLRAYPGERTARFDFLRPSRVRLQLAAIGLLFYAGTWLDKAVFWLAPSTSAPVIGPLRASPLYDLPSFLAYLSAVPAVAVFFLRLEADFAERCSSFVRAVRDGARLDEIQRIQDGMVTSARRGFVELLQVQGVTLLVILVGGPALLRAAELSPLHLRLLLIDAAGVSLQVVVLAILNVLFYLDERRPALAVIAVFAATNLAGTLITLSLGPDWYGLGFATAALAASAVGLPVLSRKLERLDRDIYLRQPLFPSVPQGEGHVPGP
jgi:polysaccharide biosynthesis protein PelG